MLDVSYNHVPDDVMFRYLMLCHYASPLDLPDLLVPGGCVAGDRVRAWEVARTCK